MRLPRTPRSGFTLVEIMVVLLIMSGLLVAISQVLQSARVSRDTIHNIQETELVGPTILDMVERDLRAISILNRDKQYWIRVVDRTVGGNDADRIDLISGVNSLVFTQDKRQERPLYADLNEVGYVLRRRPDMEDFLELFRRESFGVDDKPFEGGRYTFLCNRVLGFDIKCFAENGPDEEPVDGWNVDQNSEHTGLPKRVEIALTIELEKRVAREQLKDFKEDQRVVTYRRIYRFPDMLLEAASVEIVPKIPVIEPAVGGGGGPIPMTQIDPSAGGGGSPFGGPGAGGGGGGGSSGGGNPFGGGSGGGGNPFGGG
ncbi:MAG: prepilin-type N-terminal cleavage/methylation domain-containing protein [Planctomycetes bacterium]|nr:prepilin-type N-terminal cleavage/methylation domain-containing protein [Planctomycetota bacterium]